MANSKNGRQNIGSGTKWEEEAAYSRAVRIGNHIEVAGTTATEGDKTMYPYDAYRQAQYIFLKIEEALKDAGASLNEVVRTRMYVTDIEGSAEQIFKAHKEVFDEIRPVSTMVEVMSLIRNELVIEIEATAILPTTD